MNASARAMLRPWRAIASLALVLGATAVPVSGEARPEVGLPRTGVDYGDTNVGDPVAEEVPGRRQATRAALTQRSGEIVALSVKLTRAAREQDQDTTDRLLKELEARAGSASTFVLNIRAYVALVRGEYAEVEALLEHVLVRDPFDVNAGLNLAVVESRTGRVDRARDRLKQLALEHPDDRRIGACLQATQAW